MFRTFFFFFLEFRVSFRTSEGYPSNGSMGIFNSGTWKDLCVANWDLVERNLVCQVQGYNESSLRVHSKSGTNSLGNTTYSCEQLPQNCEEKIDTEIKCSGIDTSTIIAVLNLSHSHSTLSIKFSHQIDSTTANFRSPNYIEDNCFSGLLTTKHFPNAKTKKKLNRRLLSSAVGFS